MKKIILIVVMLLAVCGIAYAALKVRGEKTGREAVTLYGNIDVRQVQLAFRVGGRITDMFLDEGDAVGPGTAVAKLDDTPYRDALLLEEARLEAATAALDKAVNGPRTGEIEEARANVVELEATLELAEITFERSKNLLRTSAISWEAYDQAVASRNVAQGRLAAVREALNLLIEGTRKEDIAAARAEARATEAAVAAARTSLADSDLFAPSRGVVVSRVREPGAIVAAGDTVAVVSLAEPVWARVYAPEPLLGLVQPGREVMVYSDSRPDRPYRGVVGFVSPVAEFTPKTVETPELRTNLVYRVRVVIAEPDGGLRQGMPVTVTFAGE